MGENDAVRLIERYRGVVCDLDGVVYRGRDAIPHAVEALTAAREAGVRIAYATNNASRPPADVHAQLTGFGLTLDASDVLTSSQAGARHLAQTLAPGSRVLAIGGAGVRLALEECGLVAVRPAEVAAAHEAGDDPEPVVAVLQGLGKDVTWTDLAEGAFAIAGGAMWVATNADTSLPTHRGLAPGNGALIATVRHAVDRDPHVVGKPEAPLYLVCADVLGCAPDRTLAIGDRLDTDLAGAVKAGMDSLYVRTGVSSACDVARAGTDSRPRYLAVDLRGLTEPYDEPEVDTEDSGVSAVCGQARVRIDPELTLDGAGTPSQRLRAFVAACWAAPQPPDLDPAEIDAWIDGGADS